MPYITPYPADVPTLEEARSLALQAMIIESLDDLNATLALPGLPSEQPIVLDASRVVLGDPDTVLHTLICVEGGGDEESRDIEIEPHYFIPRSNKSGSKETIYTNIHVYIGHNDLIYSDAVLYTQYREIALARIRGHLRKRVFNSMQGATIPLQSQEHRADNAFDELKDCHIRSTAKGKKPKGGGKSVYVWYAHLLHVGWIA